MRRSTLLLVAGGVAAWLCGAVVASAQVTDSSQTVRYQLAESYLRGGQYPRAITLLEDLYADSPNTYLFYEKLKEAYEGVKRYDDALALVEGRLARHPNALDVRAERGRLLFLRGDEAGAHAAWDAVLAQQPIGLNTFLTVYRVLTQVRLYDRAIAVLEQGRQQLDNPRLFQADLAFLFGMVGQHERAMGEYLGMLAENAQQLDFVQDRLTRKLDDEVFLRSSLAAVERGVRQQPLNRAYRELLAWLYLEAGLYREALDAHRAIDRLNQEEGETLFTFAQQAADAKAFDVALEAYREILTRYPNGEMTAEASLGLARMHEQQAQQNGERASSSPDVAALPHYTQALTRYQDFLERFPNHPFTPDVLQRMGRLQKDVFHQYDDAIATLQRVSEQYPGSESDDAATFDLGRIAVQRGQLDQARAIFTRLEEQAQTLEMTEAARYELALLHFYQGAFDAAQTYTDAMKENISADVANDALELDVLLIESRGPDSLNTPLRLFAQAHLLHRQQQTPAALAVLDTLGARYGQHPLADDVRFLRARILRDQGQPDQAVALLLELPRLYPASFLADRSLLLAAELQEYDLHQPEAAQHTYTRLLTDYPGSLFLNQARARIRALRGDGAS
jgi:tetratricopeptide (TPR) repeat protein